MLMFHTIYRPTLSGRFSTGTFFTQDFQIFKKEKRTVSQYYCRFPFSPTNFIFKSEIHVTTYKIVALPERASRHRLENSMSHPSYDNLEVFLWTQILKVSVLGLRICP